MADKVNMSLDNIIRLDRSQRGGRGPPQGQGPRPGPRLGRLPGRPQWRSANRRTSEPGRWALPKPGGPPPRQELASALQQAKTACGQVATQTLPQGRRPADPGEAASVQPGLRSVRRGRAAAVCGFGPLKKGGVHYDCSGRSLGTAQEHFERKAEALEAMKQYNSVPMDGRPHNIQLLTSQIQTQRRLVQSVNKGGMTTHIGSGGFGSGTRGRAGRGSRVTGRRTGRNSKQQVSAEELNAQLDNYNAMRGTKKLDAQLSTGSGMRGTEELDDQLDSDNAMRSTKKLTPR